MNKIAYTAFVAFVSSVLSLLAVNALSLAGEERDADELPLITLDELAEHDSAESCWKAIHGRVYDITRYVPDHPTDEAVILEWCGKEASEGWDNKRPGVPHSPRAQDRLERYLIGRLERSDAAPWEAVVVESVADSTEAQEREPSVDERLARALLGLPLDGHYRGVFTDRGSIQINVTFDLRDGRIHALEYRHLAYRGVDYLALEEGDEGYAVLLQHRQIAERLEGEPVTRIFALYEPERVVDDIDGFSGATLRGGKVISAIRDALNRGVYSWP
ncbi:MAG: cytochrome b5 domain-containing protein [Halomonas sp.]|nr:cytochrome b5 domain-containing protein [Halomonas sp.]MDX5503879.1 cytochrome b5 domain-containing protein [Halomonas sp.]